MCSKMGNCRILVWFVSLLLLVGMATPLSAQLTKDENLSRFDDRWLHFGFYLGVNTMDYRFSHYTNVYENAVLADPVLAANAEKYYQGVHSYRAEVYPLQAGFNVGGVVNLRVNNVVDFRCTPGMMLGSRQLKFTENIDQFIDDPMVGGLLYDSNPESYKTTHSAYIDVPIGFRYKGFRSGNLRPYLYGGAAYRRDLESKRNDESALRVKRNEYFAEIAFGLDSYFPFFRLTTEFKFSYGINNIIRHDADLTIPNSLPYYGYIFKELNSNVFSLVFYFE